MNIFRFCQSETEESLKKSRRLPGFIGNLGIFLGSKNGSKHSESSPKTKKKNKMKFLADLIVILLCLCCYHNAMNCDFVFDDISALKENKDIRPETPIMQIFQNDFWGLPMDNEKSHKSYRPICVLTFRLNYLVHELRPYGYHLTNVILHIIVSLQYLRFCQLLMSFEESFIASILFSVHPIHTEAVTSLVGRAETLSALFFLASLLAYVRATIKSNWTSMAKYSSVYVFGFNVDLVEFFCRIYIEWPTLMASITSIGLATFSKEQGITAIAICFILELVFNQKLHRLNTKSLLSVWKYQKLLLLRWTTASMAFGCPRWIKEMIIRIIMLLSFAWLLLIVRMKVMRWQLPTFTKFDNPAVYASSPTRQLTNNYLYALNVWFLLNPMDLCCDWTMGSIPLVHSFMDKRNIWTLVFYMALITLLWKSYSRRKFHCSTILLTSISLMIFPFIPASNLFFPVGFVLAERVLYIPSFGFCMLISHGISTLMYNSQQIDFPANNKKTTKNYILLTSLTVFVFIHSMRTVLRNEDWKSEHSIFLSGIKVNKNNAKLFNNLGHVYETRKQYQEALTYFLKAINIQNDDIGAYSNVARIYDRLNRFDLAEHYYSTAKNILMDELQQHKEQRVARIAPGHLGLFLNLANIISRNQSRLEEADSLYKQVIKMRSDYVEAYINRGDILLRMNKTKEADHIYRIALNYDSNNADIYYNLGVVAIHSNNLNQAIDYFDKAIQLNSEHTQALFNFALVVQDAKRFELFDSAKRRLEKLSTFDENNERIYFNIAMISMANKNYTDAERWFRRCLMIKPNFPSANFNLALLLSDSQRPLEALPFLERLLDYQPNHIKALTLFGDILINYVKDFDKASECYLRILKLDPKNIQAKHNLCVVHIENNQLELAEKCLDEAKQIAPNQDYIKRHLKIVKLRIIKLKQQHSLVSNVKKN